MSHSRLSIWWMALRPKTLWAAVAPVAMGTAMAYGDGRPHWLSAIVALLGAILIQIGTNLANDYFDYIKGADTSERIGPVRVTQAGLIPPRTVRTAFLLVFALAFIAGLYLCWRGGWIMLAIGIISIICGILYTGGPYPLGYLGLGDIFVLIFFGPVAVAGTYYIQALEWSHASIVAGLAPGWISTAILAVNNLRDADTDTVAGKKTLAVRFGRNFARLEYLACLLLAGLVPVYLVVVTQAPLYTLVATATLLIAIPTAKVVCTSTDGVVLNNALASTAKLLLLYSVLFSVAYAMSGALA